METARCKAFLSAAEEGSISAAAEKLGYTASGVSQLIKSLEGELGLTLFERQKKGVKITPEGNLLLPLIRDLLTAENNLMEQAQDLRGLSVGSVTIASYPGIATFWLPGVIRAFRSEYPGIDIRLMEGIKQEMTSWLLDGAADLGFVTAPEKDAFEWYPLAEDRMVAVLPPSHPLADAPAYPLRDLEKEDFIMPALGHDVDVEQLLDAHHITPRICFTTMENPVLLALIESGMGMSIMNELCTTLWKDRLSILPLDPPASATFGIAAAKQHHLTPAASKFLEFSVRMLTRSE